MENERRSRHKVDPVAALKAYFAERKTWLQEKQDEEVDMLHGNRWDYYSRLREVSWHGTEQELAKYQRGLYRCLDDDGKAYYEDNVPGREELLAEFAATVYGLERMSYEDYCEARNGMVFLEGLPINKLRSRILSIPEPPKKDAKHFPAPAVDGTVGRHGAESGLAVQPILTCMSCGEDKYGPSFPEDSVPVDRCAKCWYHVLRDKNIMSDDTYEYYELNTPILFSGTNAACLEYAAEKWNLK